MSQTTQEAVEMLVRGVHLAADHGPTIICQRIVTVETLTAETQATQLADLFMASEAS